MLARVRAADGCGHPQTPPPCVSGYRLSVVVAAGIDRAVLELHGRGSHALVEVQAFAINRGGTRRLASIEPGTVAGCDVARQEQAI